MLIVLGVGIRCCEINYISRSLHSNGESFLHIFPIPLGTCVHAHHLNLIGENLSTLDHIGAIDCVAAFLFIIKQVPHAKFE